MDAILKWGIDLILILQGLGEWIFIPMKIFTFLGNEEFYLLLAPAIYWCINAETGLQLAIMLMLSASTNAILKISFHQPRPAWIDPAIQIKVSESSFGLPSGHAQNGLVIWSLLDFKINKLWSRIGAVLIVLLIGLSRLVLGVHFPSDVLMGWFIGLLLLWLFLKLRHPVISWVKKLGTWRKVLVALMVSMVLIMVGFTVRILLANWEVPPTWIDNAQAADPGSEPIAPLDLSGLVSNGGAFFGLASGAIFISKRGGYLAKGKFINLVLRYIVGVIGVFVLWRGLGLVFPRGEDLLAMILRYLRYGFIGFWITGLAPLVFRWLRLTSR